ncbi:MAG: hypothetical protein JNJ39_05025 [Blastocatellia bacterium]|nr:hypothetical protein [Blastocatellia bacterium]
MKMKFLVLLSITVLGSSCVTQQANDGWKEFVAEDAGFKLLLPCSPNRKVTEYNYSVGKRYGYDFSCEHAGTRFTVGFGDHNPVSGESVEKFFEYSQGHIEFAFKDFIKSRSDLSIDANPAKRYVMNPGGGRYLITALTSTKKGILHITIGPVSSPPSSEDERLFARVIDSISFFPK